MEGEFAGLEDALARIEELTAPLPAEAREVRRAGGYVVAAEVAARVNSPPTDVSAMDGFAVRSEDVAGAQEDEPVVLEVTGRATAGKSWPAPVDPGAAIGITTGAPLPEEADAVAPVEICTQHSGDQVAVREPVDSGNHVRPRAADTRVGDAVAREGQVLGPGVLGQLAAAGVSRLSVIRRPRVALIAIGDEIIAPGEDPGPRQIFASNLVTISAWLDRFRIESTETIVPDDAAAIRGAIEQGSGEMDVVLTLGGAWGSERDLVVPVLHSLGWRMAFRRVRMTPGKGAAFGLLGGSQVFCLPGGPPACEIAFLQLALPCLRRLSGRAGPPLATVPARLATAIPARRSGWTSIHHAVLSREGDELVATPHRPASRLEAMARAEALIVIPEGAEGAAAGEIVQVQVIRWPG
jgi:molybdopterin molybdotransferase